MTFRFRISVVSIVRGVTLAGVVGIAACSGTAGEAQASGAPGTRLHRDPRGFEVRIPEGWSVQPDAKTARVDILAAGGGRIVIWPQFIERKGPVDGGAVLRHLAARLWPGASWERAAARTNSPFLKGQQSGDHITAMLATSGSASGTAVVLYAMQAPAARFAALGGEALGVFSTARFFGPEERAASVSPADALQFVSWSDPREGAFSVDVPRGWQVQGGAFRAAPVDVRPSVEVRSPDGEVVVRLGDPDLPTFIEPIAFFPEGSVYNPYGTPMMSRRLTSGRTFASQYAASRCRDAELVAAADRADAVQQINAIYRRYLPSAQITAGDATFRCGARVGYYFAGLQVSRMGGPAMWKAEYLLGYLASPARAQEADAVMTRLIDSFAINPQWLAMQGGVAQGTSQAVTEAGNAISKMVSESYWTTQAIGSEISRRRSNANLGVEDVKDEFGNTYRVESGSNHYWINPRGTIVGTNVDAVPRGDFKQLVIY